MINYLCSLLIRSTTTYGTWGQHPSPPPKHIYVCLVGGELGSTNVGKIRVELSGDSVISQITNANFMFASEGLSLAA